MEKNESKTEQGCYRIEKLNGLCMPVDAKYTSFKAAVICSVFQIKEEKKKKTKKAKPQTGRALLVSKASGISWYCL